MTTPYRPTVVAYDLLWQTNIDKKQNQRLLRTSYPAANVAVVPCVRPNSHQYIVLIGGNVLKTTIHYRVNNINMSSLQVDTVLRRSPRCFGTAS